MAATRQQREQVTARFEQTQKLIAGGMSPTEALDTTGLNTKTYYNRKRKAEGTTPYDESPKDIKKKRGKYKKAKLAKVAKPKPNVQFDDLEHMAPALPDQVVVEDDRIAIVVCPSRDIKKILASLK